MIKKSITAKLFVFIMILFVLQIGIQFGFQKYFLADFYQSQKYETANETFELAVEAFFDTHDLKTQSDILYTYMAETNEPLLIFTSYQDYHPASYQTSFETSVYIEADNEIYVLPVSGIGDVEVTEDYYEFGFGEFSSQLIGEHVELIGYESDAVFIPYSFIYDGYYYDSYSVYDIFEESTESTLFLDYSEEVSLDGTIVDIEEKLLSDEIVEKTNILTNYYYQTVFEEYQTDLDQYEFTMKQVRVDGEEYYAMTMLSLQPINEVLEVQGQFQLYLTIFMVILILIISFFFSRIISKPIVAISSSTGEIANLNFDVVCDESRADEIGTLGRSINILSRSLKQKIDTLEDEIEFERRQEKIRREFVADVSHELKTPLGVIKSYSEGIMDGILKDKADYYLEVILEEVDKMNGLVLDMLELSNLESGEQKLNKSHINIKRMVSNLLRNFDQIMTDMTVHIDLEDTMMDVDVYKMELVINNLLSNAFRYVNHEKIINITLQNRELIIENSYETIDDLELRKIWDRFYRLEKSRSRTFGGNGLGLAIVKKTLDLHELEYSIENSPIGFLFKISF
ncbi:MAG: HAMP domain-containing protein [Clostridiales bacterium]|nr:HAMP domain-containing protein [Clostridiales bacterium]